MKYYKLINGKNTYIIITIIKETPHHPERSEQAESQLDWHLAVMTHACVQHHTGACTYVYS